MLDKLERVIFSLAVSPTLMSVTVAVSVAFLKSLLTASVVTVKVADADAVLGIPSALVIAPALMVLVNTPCFVPLTGTVTVQIAPGARLAPLNVKVLTPVPGLTVTVAVAPAPHAAAVVIVGTAVATISTGKLSAQVKLVKVVVASLFLTDTVNVVAPPTATDIDEKLLVEIVGGVTGAAVIDTEVVALLAAVAVRSDAALTALIAFTNPVKLADANTSTST